MTTTNRFKAIGLLILAALGGGAIGSAVTAAALHHRPDGGRRGGSDWYLELLQRELDLTATQRDSVEAVLERHSAPMEAIWADMTARIDTARAAIRADIRLQLTAEQQQRFAELTARLDADRRRRNANRREK